MISNGNFIMSSSSSNWSEVHEDILIQILGRLSPIEIIRLGTVSRSWRSVARQIVSSSSHNATVPWLMQHRWCEPCFCCFFKIVGSNLYQQKIRIYMDLFMKYECIGSSHGWLVLIDDSLNLFLLNPFSNTRISLPHLRTFIEVVDSVKYSRCYEVLLQGERTPRLMHAGELEECFITKAIMSSSPFEKNNSNYGVILIYNKKLKLGYWKHGNKEWKQLEVATQGCYYDDIICNNNRVHALSSCWSGGGGGNGWSVEVWDFHEDVPVKLMQVKPPVPDSWQRYQRLSRKRGNEKLSYYSVESLGNIFVVARIIRCNMQYSSTVPYQVQSSRMSTYAWALWELDWILNRWIRLDSIGDRVLFLGGNHSISLSAQDLPDLLSNTIYFTEDPWCYSWENRHKLSFLDDVGCYYLSSKIFEYFYPKAPSLWVVPNPW